jgi:hypothetical protein
MGRSAKRSRRRLMQSWVAGGSEGMGSKCGEGAEGTDGMSLSTMVMNLLRKM